MDDQQSDNHVLNGEEEVLPVGGEGEVLAGGVRERDCI